MQDYAVLYSRWRYTFGSATPTLVSIYAVRCIRPSDALLYGSLIISIRFQIGDTAPRCLIRAEIALPMFPALVSGIASD